MSPDPIDVDVLETHFAIIPEWVLDADIRAQAVRLYGILLRYGQTSGVRMPGRAALAARMHVKDPQDRRPGGGPARRPRRTCPRTTRTRGSARQASHPVPRGHQPRQSGVHNPG